MRKDRDFWFWLCAMVGLAVPGGWAVASALGVEGAWMLLAGGLITLLATGATLGLLLTGSKSKGVNAPVTKAGEIVGTEGSNSEHPMRRSIAIAVCDVGLLSLFLFGRALPVPSVFVGILCFLLFAVYTFYRIVVHKS